MNALSITRETITVENELLKEIRIQEDGVLNPNVQIGDKNTPEGFDNFLYQELMETAEGKKSQKQVLEELQADWESRCFYND